MGNVLGAWASVLPAVLMWFLWIVPAWAEVFQAKVIGIADGDTITVLHDGRPEKIRLASIDCPEKAQAYGHQAKEFTAAMVFRQVVQVDASGKDRYGRTIGKITTSNGKVLNEELVKAGLAWWYRKYAPEDARLAEMERQARERRLGLWADRDPVPPWEFRKQQRGWSRK